MKLKFEDINIDCLIPYSRNARTHSDSQVAQIASSIREFGFLAPVIVDADMNIVAGHGRVLAARKLRLKSVPCVQVDHLTPAQRRAYTLADNKLALNAGWDFEMLDLELSDLKEMDFDTDLTGFALDELKIELEGNLEDIPAGGNLKNDQGDIWVIEIEFKQDKGSHMTFISQLRKLVAQFPQAHIRRTG